MQEGACSRLLAIPHSASSHHAASNMEPQDPGQPPSRERIRIFLRVRPTPRPTTRVALGAAEEPPWVEFNVPKDPGEGLINNSREAYRFTFDGLLPPDAGQEEVFERVALPVLRSALDGYNGTVFAFGQTGSGKTFTITGGAARYADRGLIPRALSSLFAEAGRRSDHTFAVHVSYMEIYNETGFDLLDPGREVRALEDLPKVSMMEDDDGRVHFRGLSMHRCSTEEQALNMLFLGDTNRVVAATPLNQASSRSHCVFTLHIEARRAGEALVRRSKLHFVDLAGSERAGKTGLAAHVQLKEAKFINLSLHYLEQVIISLQDGRPHVPYRNSLLTMVLRDSLGGNTRTVMVAAVAPEAQHIEESISTCRFAQRVALISNRVEVNEELDPEVLIRKLKAENTLLRQELQLLRAAASAGGGANGAAAAGEEGQGEDGLTAQQLQQAGAALSEEEQHLLRRQVAAFVEDPSPDAVLGVEGSMRFIRAAFEALKSMARSGSRAASAAGQAGRDAQAAAAAEELRGLRQLVQQQEQQIGVLAGVLRKQGLVPEPGSAAHSRRSSGASNGSTGSGQASQPAMQRAVAGAEPTAASSFPGFQQPPQLQRPGSAVVRQAGQPNGYLQQHQQQQAQQRRPGSSAGGGGQQGQGAPGPAAASAYSDEVLADQHKAFEYFCATSPAHDVVSEHKAVLRGRFEQARTLGAQVNACKQRIGELKSSVEQRRLARTMAALLRQQQGGGGAAGAAEEAEEQRRAEAEEERAKGQIEQEKAAYREAYGRLREVKGEIDSVQAALEHARARLQHDFQAWYAAMSGSVHSSGGSPGDGARSPGGGVKDGAHGGSGGEEQRAVQEPSGQQELSLAPGSHAAGQLPASAWAVNPQQQMQQPASQQQPAPSLDTHASADSSRQAQQAAAEDPFAGVDPEVLAAARPLLTGNPQADADIIKFYQARAELLKGMR